MRGTLAQGIIDALPEPTFLLTAEGAIIGANRAARSLLGADALGGQIGDRLVTPARDLAVYLRRARMTSSPLPGALTFRTGEGQARFRVHCCRLSGAGDEVTLMLRCADTRSDRFSILAERVRHLDEELRRRVREKAVLDEILSENRNLMRELQHRVKNNIQVMMSILTMSAANASSDDVRRFASGAKDRFRAMATTQDLIYEAQSEAEVPARELFTRLAKSIEETTNGAISIEADIEDLRLPQENAHCLALIANELITNSIKHGTEGCAGTVHLQLTQSYDRVHLVVRDSGRGYPDVGLLPRTSGLALVRGLCRQIGASFEIGNDPGAKSVVSFGVTRPERREATPSSNLSVGGTSA